MLPYFPMLRDEYEMPMNAQAGVEALIEVEQDKFKEQLALKSEIVASDRDYYVQCLPHAEAIVWETLEMLLPHMAVTLPQYFALEIQGDCWHWTNTLLETTQTFTLGDPETLPLSPLDWLGRQVQEDLILMEEGTDGGTFCAAGHLCFGAIWCLPDKMGRSFLTIHNEVPEFHERIGRPSDLLMRRLKAARPVSRANWNIVSTDRLNLAPKLADEWRPTYAGITPKNAGDRLFFRVERQTLTRLPRTRGVLFTIHTYLNPLAEVVADPQRHRRLASVVAGIPPAILEYKGMAPFMDTLLAYLSDYGDDCRKIANPLGGSEIFGGNG